MPNQVYYADFIIYKEYSIIHRTQLPISFKENKLWCGVGLSVGTVWSTPDINTDSQTAKLSRITGSSNKIMQTFV